MSYGQVINYEDDGTVMVYHTIPSQQGTPDFEHKGRVVLADLVHGKKRDGTDDPDTLLVNCPVSGCRTHILVSLTGDEESQRLHAKVRFAKGQQARYISESVQSVINDVRAKGGNPRLKPQEG